MSFFLTFISFPLGFWLSAWTNFFASTERALFGFFFFLFFLSCTEFTVGRYRQAQSHPSAPSSLVTTGPKDMPKKQRMDMEDSRREVEWECNTMEFGFFFNFLLCRYWIAQGRRTKEWEKPVVSILQVLSFWSCSEEHLDGTQLARAQEFHHPCERKI